MHRPNQLIHLTGAIFITLLAVGCNADIVTPTDTPIVHVTTAVSSPATVTSTSVSATAFAVEYSATSTGPALTSTRTTDQLALTPEATPVSRAGVTVIFEKAAIVDQFDLSGSINLSDLSNAIPAAWRVSSNSAPRYVI